MITLLDGGKAERLQRNLYKKVSDNGCGIVISKPFFIELNPV